MSKVINLLARNIYDITFDDVVEFCQQKVLESVQLDYKQNIPRDLAKHFATFSNTQGGLIIIGVGEDSATGLPTTYDGIPNDSKHVDRIHQFAANVTPLPTYDVRTTDEQSGNLFILVRIYEGAAPPYTTLNDPTVWIRTGNISTPASREELLRLANKRRDAETTRLAKIAFAKQYFMARVAEADQEREQAIQAGEKNIHLYPIGSKEHSAILSLTLQPYYPHRQLTTPPELLNRLLQYCDQECHRTVFFNHRVDTLPGGIAGFSSNKSTGYVIGEQLYADGVYNLMEDVLTEQDQKLLKAVNMNIIATDMYSRLKIVQSFYKMTAYSGLIVGTINLKGGSGAEVLPLLSPTGRAWLPPQCGKVRLSSYDWSFELDTATLYDEAALNQFFGKIIRDISWGLGIPEVSQKVIDAILQYNRWLAPAPSNP